METRPAPSLEHDPGGRPVASYRDLGGATLAARRLVDAGQSAESIRIVPRSLEALDDEIPVRQTPVDGDRLGLACVAVGAVVGAGTWLLGGGTGALALGVLTAVVSAVALAVAVRLWETAARRRARRLGSTVRAERFDVVVSPDAAGSADHLLATWWDPAAVPVPRASIRDRMSRRRAPA